jgi:hypothetical protein
MYQKPELVLIGDTARLVLGPIFWFDDSEVFSLSPIPWLEQGLDD